MLLTNLINTVKNNFEAWSWLVLESSPIILQSHCPLKVKYLVCIVYSIYATYIQLQYYVYSTNFHETETKFSRYLKSHHTKARRNMKHIVFPPNLVQGNVAFRMFHGFVLFSFSFLYKVILNSLPWKDMKKVMLK